MGFPRSGMASLNWGLSRSGGFLAPSHPIGFLGSSLGFLGSWWFLGFFCPAFWLV